MNQFIFIIIGGFIAGFASGILGIGGGVLLVPLLIYGFKLEVHQAIGTSLAVIIPTALFGSLVHYYHGNVMIRFVFSLFIFTIIGSILGSHFASLLPAATLKKIFAVFLGGIAIKMFFYG